MKKFYLAVYLSIAISLLNAQTLVAHYRFNGDANDASGNNNNGTANGATLSADRFSNSNKAYSFDGVSDNISIPDDPTLALMANYTIIAWIKATVTPGDYSIASKDEGPGMNTPKWIFVLQNGNLAYHINGPGLGNGEWGYSNAFTLTLGQWYHVAMSKSGTNVTFYISGAAIGTVAFSNSSVNPSSPLQLGNAEAGLGFNGSLDEMKFYDYALTGPEIANDYSITLPVKLVDFSAVENGNSVAVTWTTASETGLDHFEVEKSTAAGFGFAKIAAVNAAGGTDHKEYSINDNNPFNGINYYRLKSIDKDGHFEYSRIVKVDFNEEHRIRIFPNPTHNYMSVYNTANFTSMKITDVMGNTIKQFVKNTSNKYSIEGLPKGFYLLQLVVEDQLQIERLIIN